MVAIRRSIERVTRRRTLAPLARRLRSSSSRTFTSRRALWVYPHGVRMGKQYAHESTEHTSPRRPVAIGSVDSLGMIGRFIGDTNPYGGTVDLYVDGK